ncbi:MAG: cell division protein FtsB [Gammaproteobacteria bacterium]|nr:cell division protein FtsB [Gammaproteobacteria bacterium]
MKILLAGLMFLFVELQYTLWVGDKGLVELWRLQKTVAATKQENQRLQHRNTILQAEVVDLKTGLDAIEERARSDLGMIKKDEIFFQIIEE